MGDNIIKFPGIDKSWEEIEASALSVFNKYGYGKADMAEHIIGKLKELYSTHCKTEDIAVTLPAEIPLALVYELNRQISSHYKGMIVQLVVEILHKEIELYNLNNGYEKRR